MKKVYVCSPYRGNIEKNIQNAKNYCREIILDGDLPICPHIYFTQFLDDNKDDERNLAFEINKELIKNCDLINIYIRDGYISEGMKQEIALAETLGISCCYNYRA